MMFERDSKSAMVAVDVVVLSRDESPLAPRVQEGISQQSGIQLQLHRVIGTPQSQDACRWESIARARNQGKELGTSPWLMFLDDDVVLAPGCMPALLRGLRRRPSFGALAADYLGEGRYDSRRGHVAMGATLFRRAALKKIEYRWEAERCECQCCCDDLRRLGIRIAYLAQAHAEHLNLSEEATRHTGVSVRGGETFAALPGRVMVAFNRRHYPKFRQQFLPSLRAAGNDEPVTVTGYGIYPSQQRMMARLSNVEVRAFPADNVFGPPDLRMRDFQTVLSALDARTPVAYWDAGDVVFQHNLTPLWQKVREFPDRILAVREPVAYPQNPVVATWTMSIQDPTARQYAFDLLTTHPFLNSGFLAATAGTMRKYFSAAHDLRHSVGMKGSHPLPGDQIALNLYCHANSESWQEIEAGWNYCLYGRQPSQHYFDGDGRLASRDGTPIYVIHGNARTLGTGYYGSNLLSIRGRAWPVRFSVQRSPAR